MSEGLRNRWPAAPLFKARLWLRENGRSLLSSDLGCALFVSLATSGAALRWSAVRTAALELYIASGALGVALLGVALTAMAILVGLLDENYLLVLRQAHKAKGGLKYALLPYRIVSVVSALAFLAGVGSLVVSGVLPWYGTAFAMGVVSGLGAWGLCGTVQLVGITAFHGLKKADLIDLRRQLGAQLNEARETERRPGES